MKFKINLAAILLAVLGCVSLSNSPAQAAGIQTLANCEATLTDVQHGTKLTPAINTKNVIRVDYSNEEPYFSSLEFINNDSPNSFVVSLYVGPHADHHHTTLVDNGSTFEATDCAPKLFTCSPVAKVSYNNTTKTGTLMSYDKPCVPDIYCHTEVRTYSLVCDNALTLKSPQQ